MLKSFTLAVLGAFAEAAYVDGIQYMEGIYNGKEDFTHNHVWGHTHYDPGNVKRFDGHLAEIEGADDLSWGPNGFQNPLTATNKDSIHNWDDSGDAYVCHSCGGHGCEFCGGYGHFHRTAQFGYHGHNLKNGFGVGHWHTYLGPKVRSSYNKYKHGIGGRYTQRWSNGYGDRYGINAGERYGLMHRWGMYNGIGKGNPSSKGSVMGYGIGANAEIPTLLPNRMGGTYEYPKEQPAYGYDEADYGYDDYYGEEEYDHDHYEGDGYDHGDEHYDDHHEEEAYGDDYGYEKNPYLPVVDGKQYYTNFAAGYGDPAGAYGNLYYDPVGSGHKFPLSFGHGHGNHSPYNGEYERSDKGLYNYVFRPERLDRNHTPPGYYNN